MSSYVQWAGEFFGGRANPNSQNSGMLSKEQLLQLFQDFLAILDKPETKKRMADAVKARKEPVTLTTEIQEELFSKMGVDPKFGVECLGKVNTTYADDRDLMIKFYEFVSREEMAIEEAELGPEAFQQKMEQVKKIQQQQMGMLQQLRGLPVDQQESFLRGLQSQMQQAQSGPSGAAMSPQEIQEFFLRQQQTLQQRTGQSPQKSMWDEDVAKGNRSGSQPALHQRHI